MFQQGETIQIIAALLHAIHYLTTIALIPFAIAATFLYFCWQNSYLQVHTFMLIEHFYTVTQTKAITSNSWIISLEIHPQHELFEGHFPGNSIVPGVCMLQLIKECAEKLQNQALRYSIISSCKFLAAINPVDTPALLLHLSFKERKECTLQIQAEGKIDIKGEENPVFIKLKANLAEK